MPRPPRSLSCCGFKLPVEFFTFQPVMIDQQRADGPRRDSEMIGNVIGNYRIEREIGEGGMSHVYVGRTVARNMAIGRFQGA